LESLTYTDEAFGVTATVRRGMVVGTVTRKLSGVEQKVDRPTVPEAVPSLAVPALAAALPQREGVVMPLAVISELDLQTRLGYALETGGKATYHVAGEDRKGHAVRLWHYGQVEATYFFSADRTLEYAEYEAGVGGVTLQRAVDETAALKALIPLAPKTPPAPRP
jgi:hypothetical protein